MLSNSTISNYMRSILKLIPYGRLKKDALDEGLCPEFHKSKTELGLESKPIADL